MQIQVDKLKSAPRRIELSEQAADLPALSALVEQGRVEFVDLISGRLEAVRTGDAVAVTGSLVTTVVMDCSRCLAKVTCPLDLTVALSYVRKTGDHGEEVADEVELDPDELGTIQFSEDTIELTDDIAQEVVMALPQQPLCSDDCRGLCLLCGCDLNASGCDCEPPLLHAGLAALKGFKVEN